MELNVKSELSVKINSNQSVSFILEAAQKLPFNKVLFDNGV